MPTFDQSAGWVVVVSVLWFLLRKVLAAIEDNTRALVELRDWVRTCPKRSNCDGS